MLNYPFDKTHMTNKCASSGGFSTLIIPVKPQTSQCSFEFFLEPSCFCWYLVYQIQTYNEPVHEISNNVVCATSKASDQPAHTCSLIRAFASRLSILWLLSY